MVSNADLKPLFSPASPFYTRLLRDVLKPAVVFDVGANYGGYTRGLLIDCDVKQVHAFEPVPSVFAQMSESFKDDKRVRANQLGVSDVCELVRDCMVQNAWTISPSNLGMDTAVDFQGVKFDMQLITLDAYVAAHNITRVDYIKLDVDGYEYRVIKGATATLDRFKPVIFFEMSYLPSKIGDSCEDMIQAILNMGYYFVSLDGVCRTNDFDFIMAHFPWHTSYDVFLIHGSKLDHILAGCQLNKEI